MPVAPDLEHDADLWDQLESVLAPPCALNREHIACWIAWFQNCHYCDAHKQPECQGHFLCDWHLENLVTGQLTCARCNAQVHLRRVEPLH